MDSFFGLFQVEEKALVDFPFYPEEGLIYVSWPKPTRDLSCGSFLPLKRFKKELFLQDGDDWRCVVLE